MIKISLAAVTLALLFLPVVRGEPRPDEPLIFFLEVNGGPKNCLIALSHLTLLPAIESIEIIDCEKRARALVLEASPALIPRPYWSGYERKHGDPGISNISGATFKKIVPALKRARYSDKDIQYFLTLHPIAIYRALTYSKLLAPKPRLSANLDIQVATIANSKNFKIIEMEGMPSYFHSERQLTIEQIDLLISRMCDLLLQPESIADYAVKVNQYVQDLSSQPDVDTAWNKKFWFNTVALGLPSYTMSHDVDSRNVTMVNGMLKAMDAEESVLIFIGSAHIGGPNGVLKQLERRGVKITRIR